LDEPFPSALARLRKEVEREICKPRNILIGKKKGGGFMPEFEIIVASKKKEEGREDVKEERKAIEVLYQDRKEI